MTVCLPELVFWLNLEKRKLEDLQQNVKIQRVKQNNRRLPKMSAIRALSQHSGVLSSQCLTLTMRPCITTSRQEWAQNTDNQTAFC